MQYDRKITISTGASRKATVWIAQSLFVSELWDRLKTPAQGTDTLASYLSLSKGDQDNLKDVGGFVGGTFRGQRRKAMNVIGRDIITLDLDNIPAGGTDDVLRRVESLGCGYCVYSTRKHQPAAPRLRVLFPLDRTVSVDEYEPIARKMAAHIGIEFADPTTFEASRLMYWPSCCADSQYVYIYADKPLLSADGILAQYPDWHDMTQWPALPGQQAFTRQAVKQGDPELKKGVVGAFCRIYDIRRAMDELLPGIYEPVDTMPGRYTFVEGSTTGGAVLYENGRFLYSHHATDPCGGKLVNAFDLVRLHKFGEKDDEAKTDTPINRMPSFLAMCDYACDLQEVSSLIARERMERVKEDFAGVADVDAEDPVDWYRLLSRKAQSNTPKATIDNVRIILENDPKLKGRFALNEFAGRGEVLLPLPWDPDATKRRLWTDNDNAGLYWYLETTYDLTCNGKVDAALSLHSNKYRFNEIRDYLYGLVGKWDGTPRLDTLFIDYLGAKDNAYNRAVTRKAFTAAVARAMTPGCKFDNMVILAGPQGIGKSTLLDKMSRGWFNDSIRTFEGKEASELLQGVWLVEVSELDAFRKTDVARIKQFLSLRNDRFRAAYGRHVKEIPRSCIFFGTTNTTEYLQDTTGNRRFWPIDTGEQAAAKNVWRDLDAEIDQLWAEAVVRWQCGEALFLSGAIEKAAKLKQEEHREVSMREGVIRDFLSKQVPEDWSKWQLENRRTFWANNAKGDYKLVDRDKVCALEVWCELFGGSVKEMKNADTREINAIITATGEWVKSQKTLHFGPYGSGRGFVRKSV